MSATPKNKTGRPTDYTPELAKEICDTIASNSAGVKRLCKENPDWPSHNTIYRWLANFPEFRDQYAQAKKCQIDLLVDEILEIADDSSNDYLVYEQGNVSCNSEWIARSRLRIDTRKWLASKLVPKVYGTLKQIDNPPPLSVIERLLFNDIKHSSD
ncbi:Uncharacterised protein [Legionella lansingensis]|uniref:Terminase small subunit n=1 Tax=Legionella lansingensis TaxID=45067 RepID=A0A0W0VEZ8_9GAMM|nr:helix-turn-helix domain-containing protein [Legionella lansingensis]KTD18725.1 hypothetical protein Llan_2328 [Legionella lansingensis]SNV58048.1 Uncharacterised protein [Legionella lansingensis]